MLTALFPIPLFRPCATCCAFFFYRKCTDFDVVAVAYQFFFFYLYLLHFFVRELLAMDFCVDKLALFFKCILFTNKFYLFSRNKKLEGFCFELKKNYQLIKNSLFITRELFSVTTSANFNLILILFLLAFSLIFWEH